MRELRVVRADPAGNITLFVLTPVEKAEDADVEIRQLMGKIIAFDKGEKFRMLTAQTQSDIILALKDIVKSFEEQQA